MSRKKLVLAYHIDNQEIAKQIEQQFSAFGYTFRHVNNGNQSIGNQLTEANLPTILLVSDNFLKSVSSMENSMEWTQKMLNSNLLLPVVIDGKEKNEQTGKMENHSTIFQRVSDVIKYMNYWQDQYLLLRKKRRTAPIEQEPALSAKLQVVKGVSAEIGEYLRFLKNQNPISFSDFSKSGYAAFFKFTDDETGQATYNTKHPFTENEVTQKEKVKTPESTAINPPTPAATKESKTINERFGSTTSVEKEPEIPVFEPAKVPSSGVKKTEETKPKINEKETDEIPVFIPAVVPERSRNGGKTEPEELKEKEEKIPVFKPAVVPENPKKEELPTLKEEKDLTKKEDDIPVFVPAVVPDRSIHKVEEEKILAQNSDKKETSKGKANAGLVDIIQSSSRQLLAENEKKQKSKIEQTEEIPPVDLDTLPGMELLTEKEKKTEIKPQNLEDDFIKSIDAFDDFNENDMEFEDENVGSLEDLAAKIEEEEKDNNGVSMDKLNQIVDEVIEEEARDTKDLSANEEEELSDLMSILEENKAEEDAAIEKGVGSKNKADSGKQEKSIEDDISDVFSEMEKDYEPEKLKTNTSDLNDEELVRLISEMEDRNADLKIQKDFDKEKEEKSILSYQETSETEEESSDLNDIFEEDEEEENDADYMETDTQISRAYQYFEAANWDGGLAVLQDGLSQKPEDSDLRFQYALALAKHKSDFDGATQQLEILLGFDQQHEEAFFLLGELAELHQDFLMARNYYEKVAAINDDFPEIYYRLGIITNLHFDDQKESAANYFKKAIKKNKLNADAHYRLGILQNEHFENHLKAVKYFKKVLDIQPEHPFANYDLAILYHRLGDRALANIYYQKAVETNPELKTPDNDAAFKYELIGNVEKGIITTNYGDSKEAELSRDMARLEVKMTNLKVEDPTVSQKAMSALFERLGEDEMKELENLFRKKMQEVSATNIPDTPKPPAKTILITGATSGIGRATAELFAENGYRIIMTGRREERLEALKDDFENRFGSDVLTLPFDVRNVEETQSAIDSLTAEWREIDILLNNAGLAKGTSPIHEGNLNHWEQMIDTNIKGLLYMTRAIAPHMVANREGHIINIASSAGKEVYPGGNVYCATKHAVDALTRAMRIDLHTHNVRVSQVAPGMVEETEFSLVRYDGDAEKAKIYSDFNPLTARDVAEVIYFVATRPKHVNVQDVLLFGTQQANSIYTHRDGREE